MIIARPFMQLPVEWTLTGYYDIPATECPSTCIQLNAHYILGNSRESSRALANTLKTIWSYIRQLPLDGHAQLGWKEAIPLERRPGVRLLIAIGAYRPIPWIPRAAIQCTLSPDGPTEESRGAQDINAFIAPHAIVRNSEE